MTTRGGLNGTACVRRQSWRASGCTTSASARRCRLATPKTSGRSMTAPVSRLDGPDAARIRVGASSDQGGQVYTVDVVSGSSAEAAERPLPVTERGRRTRALIIDAAATLMYQQGVSMTSLDDVLAAADSGKSQLYHYFDSKADLIAAVIQRQLQLVLARQPRLQQIDSWDGIEAWAAEILRGALCAGRPVCLPTGHHGR